MRVIIWNILHGGGPERIAPITLALTSHVPDVVALLEFRAARGGQIRAVLADHGLVHQSTSFSASRSNGILLASRVRHTLIDSSPVPGRWLEANLEPGSVRFVAAHIPDDSDPAGKARYWHELIAWARRSSGTHAMIAGDLNTARRGRDSEGLGTGCESLMGTVTTLGFTDPAAKRLSETRENTWISRIGAGARIDAALLSASLLAKLQSCQYDHAVRDDSTSDHSLLRLDFQALAPHATHTDSSRSGSLFLA